MDVISDKKHFSTQITERFLFAMDRILGSRNTGKVTAKSFGEMVGIASSNLNRIRQNPDENFVTIEACGRLCHYYKISASWLIGGIGNLYHDDELFAAYQTLENRLGNVEDALAAMQLAMGTIKERKGENKKG